MSADETPRSLWPDPEALGTLTDLYQLTMVVGYHASGMARRRATFELFVRKLPPGRSYLVFAGMGPAIEDLLRLKITPEQLEAIRALPMFEGVDPELLDELGRLRFRGDVWAVPEGTVVFPGEPLVRVEAELPEAQWAETYLLSMLSYTTLAASKAARIVSVAAGRSLVEFGTRRGHGPLSALLCARAAYIAGFDGTSNVEASIRLGIPCYGTMAHSWVQAFGHEGEAFSAFARAFPRSTTLLVDTYDTLRGVEEAAGIEPPIRGIRLDSGDLGELAVGARAILDRRGRGDVRIMASSDLDERRIAELVKQDAPIDAFGVGTELITSRDAPALSMVYKLVAVDGAGRMKLSTGKRSYPGAKQVYRRYDAHGLIVEDVIAQADEPGPRGSRALLEPVVRDGVLLRPLPHLEDVRAHCRRELVSLPGSFLRLDEGPEAPVRISEGLQAEADRLAAEVGG